MGLLASMRQAKNWKPGKTSAVKKKIKREKPVKVRKSKTVAERVRNPKRKKKSGPVRQFMWGEKRTAILLRLPVELLAKIDKMRAGGKNGPQSRPYIIAELLKKALKIKTD